MERLKSLRTQRGPSTRRRAQPPPPVPEGGQPTSTKPTVTRSLTKARDGRKSRVDDRIKKRASRYAEISSPTDAVGVPAVPALPAGLAREEGLPPVMEDGAAAAEVAGALMGRDTRREDVKLAEMQMLDSKQFDADACECISMAAGGDHPELMLRQSSSSSLRARQSMKSSNCRLSCGSQRTMWHQSYDETSLRSTYRSVC
jgi:hypothetical protein